MRLNACALSCERRVLRIFVLFATLSIIQKVFDDPHELMRRAKEEIGKSDALLIDMMDKPTGRAIEAGIAFALNKKIIVIMKKGTAIKDTGRGIADVIVEYAVIEDIIMPLKKWMNDSNLR